MVGRHFYEFGTYRLDVLARRLFRADQAVALTPKAFETLLLLVRNHHRTLDKRELMQARGGFEGARRGFYTVARCHAVGEPLRGTRRGRLSGKWGHRYVDHAPCTDQQPARDLTNIGDGVRSHGEARERDRTRSERGRGCRGQHPALRHSCSTQRPARERFGGPAPLGAEL